MPGIDLEALNKERTLAIWAMEDRLAACRDGTVGKQSVLEAELAAAEMRQENEAGWNEPGGAMKYLDDHGLEVTDAFRGKMASGGTVMDLFREMVRESGDLEIFKFDEGPVPGIVSVPEAYTELKVLAYDVMNARDVDTIKADLAGLDDPAKSMAAYIDGVKAEYPALYGLAHDPKYVPVGPLDPEIIANMDRLLMDASGRMTDPRTGKPAQTYGEYESAREAEKQASGVRIDGVYVRKNKEGAKSAFTAMVGLDPDSVAVVHGNSLKQISRMFDPQGKGAGVGDIYFNGGQPAREFEVRVFGDVPEGGGKRPVVEKKSVTMTYEDLAEKHAGYQDRIALTKSGKQPSRGDQAEARLGTAGGAVAPSAEEQIGG